MRERLAPGVLDPGSFVEDALAPANAAADDLPAGRRGDCNRHGRRSPPVYVMANDPTVKAGSWASDRREDRAGD
ncbi:MAG: hypothetical protein R2690_16410 [Acidimicrobiales bacterium]